MGEDLFKASDEVRDQLADLRVLKQFVKKQREQIADDNMTRMYVGRSKANQRRQQIFQNAKEQ